MYSFTSEINSFEKVFQRAFDAQSPQVIVKAPGRINLIGEHTDYNMGLVIPAAIDKYFLFGLKYNQQNQINIYALDIDEHCSIPIDEYQKSDRPWLNFFIGIVKELQRQGHALGGFDCMFTSTVPQGAGMSSSSALECGFLAGLNVLFHLGLGNWELIEISKNSNHHFLGIKGGIMDQFASLFGKKDHSMLLDCRDHSFEYIPLEISEYRFVLINSNVSHEHLTGGYNNRPKECQEALTILQKEMPKLQSLRDLDDLKQMKNLLPPLLTKRVQFVIEENERVIEFVKALKSNDIEQLGRLLYASHYGLSRDYEVSCPELDVLVELTKELKYIAGSRMMGGGFGGCTINLVHQDFITKFIDEIKKAYHEIMNIEAEFYNVQLSNGVEIIKNNQN